jgi:virulence-associated protein VagC
MKTRRAKGKTSISSPPGPRGRGKIFWTGRSQALRLPKEFRFEVKEVALYREGHRLVVEPIEVEKDAHGWPTAWWDLAGAAPEFEVGDRNVPHERGDIFSGRR